MKLLISISKLTIQAQGVGVYMPGGERYNQNMVSIKCGKINAGKSVGFQCYRQFALCTNFP